MKNISKYLEQYAEQHIVECGTRLVNYLTLLLTDSITKPLTFEHVVVIPAYKESPDFIERLLSSPLIEQNVLFIIVINQPDSDEDNNLQQSLADFIKNSGNSEFKHESLELISTNKSSSFLIIDAFTQPLAVDHGVGLARKIGSDLALLLKSENIIKSEWIHSTDADSHLPNDYFLATQSLNQTKNISAVSYNFTHVSDDLDIHTANSLYETALRYYVKGLTFAGSQYNFFTIGSVIAFKAKDYAMVRGFPKRSAGEDFYLLNKLAKLGKVEFLKDTLVKIDARTSDRVPFGTGPSVANILQLKINNQAYCYYHPQIFAELKTCLVHFNSLWEHRLIFESWLSELSTETQQALLEAKLDGFVSKQKNNNQTQFNKQLHVWFDAFKTLKFIHSLREQKYADIPLEQSIELAKF
ncbi:hypothetical protein WNY51_04475 [Pseudocolwellia sp. AS88]|uniref:hypothetical protein n=1 Tax=Pseudocolwellia sp. AS88 TaxID=3063958 RepID=UPI0026F2C32E|nr:hypothetical protein [Pseudocolwellia sp. AS88]MDO7086305.1 hypothetical protein [Pseudocolwellia sp. AS88]